jgi:hypothetical protein
MSTKDFQSKEKEIADYIITEVARLKAVFQDRTDEFFNELTDRLTEHKFTQGELHDAVNRVIDYCNNNDFCIAEVIQEAIQISRQPRFFN